MVLLVQLVKSMREMGYKPYLGETRCFDSREVDLKSEGTRILGIETKEM